MTQGTWNKSCGHIRKWTSVLWARVQLHRMWEIAFRNGTLDSNAGRNVKRSADVWGNARHFCDGDLNFTPEFNYRIREKAFIGDDGSQFSRKRSVRPCGLNSKGLSLCLFELNSKKYQKSLQIKCTHKHLWVHFLYCLNRKRPNMDMSIFGLFCFDSIQF